MPRCNYLFVPVDGLSLLNLEVMTNRAGATYSLRYRTKDGIEYDFSGACDLSELKLTSTHLQVGRLAF